jgi:hypothetical protein
MKKSFLVTIFATILFVAATTAYAQTTISNVPSAGVIDPKSFYAEFDYAGHFSSFDKGGFHLVGARLIYGVSKNVEIGTNVYYTRNGGVSPVEVDPNIKFKAYENEKYKVTVSGGAIAFIPVRDVPGARPTALIYASAAKAFDPVGMKFTGGVYAVLGAKSGNRKGVMLGYEQTINKKATFMADWMSGDNRFGVLAAGVGYAVTKKDSVYAGYNVGNNGRGNNWFNMYYARYF